MFLIIRITALLEFFLLIVGNGFAPKPVEHAEIVDDLSLCPENFMLAELRPTAVVSDRSFRDIRSEPDKWPLSDLTQTSTVRPNVAP
jgi:hypothetical protein